MSPIGDNAAECHRSSLSWPMTNSLLPAFGPPQSQKTGVGSGSQLCPATRIIRSHKESTSRCSIQPKTTGFFVQLFCTTSFTFFSLVTCAELLQKIIERKNGPLSDLKPISLRTVIMRTRPACTKRIHKRSRLTHLNSSHPFFGMSMRKYIHDT